MELDACVPNPEKSDRAGRMLGMDLDGLASTLTCAIDRITHADCSSIKRVVDCYSQTWEDTQVDSGNCCGTEQSLQ